MNKNSFEHRYDRQRLLPEIGDAGQKRLADATVAIIGVGGLGCPVAMLLAGAGIGHLRLIDPDVVAESNLHRQLLYTESEIGQPKALCAARRLQQQNRACHIETFVERFTLDNAARLLEGCQIVVGCTDNFASRYQLDDYLLQHAMPCVYGAVSGFEGQVAVFHAQGDSPRYADLYPDRESLIASQPNRAIMPTTPYLVGSVMAQQVISLICQVGEPLIGQLWSIDLRTLQAATFEL